MVFATAVPASAPTRFQKAAQNGGPGRQHFGRNDRGDGVGRVVEAVDVLKHQGREEDQQEQGHEAGAASGVLQHDLHDDVAGVAAAVDGLLDHLVELLQR
jgi:hypothetical protein